MENEKKPHFWTATQAEMTGGDIVKLQLASIAVLAGAYGVFAGTLVAADKVSNWRWRRKNAQIVNELESVE